MPKQPRRLARRQIPIMTGAEKEKPIVPNPQHHSTTTTSKSTCGPKVEPRNPRTASSFAAATIPSKSSRCSRERTPKRTITETITDRIEEAPKVTERFVRIFSTEWFYPGETLAGLPESVHHVLIHQFAGIHRDLGRTDHDRSAGIGQTDRALLPVHLLSSIYSTDDLFSVEPLTPHPIEKHPTSPPEACQAKYSNRNYGFMSRINLHLRDEEDNIDNDMMAQDVGENSRPIIEGMYDTPHKCVS